MSRRLSSTEQRICRGILAFLGAMFFAFLLLNTIESLSTSSPPVNKLQPGTTNASSHPKSSLAPQLARSQTQPAQPAPDNPAPVPPPAVKGRSHSPEKTSLETAIRFDPQRLEQRLDATSLVPARGLFRVSSEQVPAQIPSTESFESAQGGPIVTPMFASAEPESTPASKKTAREPLAPSTQTDSKQAGFGDDSLNAGDVQQIQARLRDLGFLSAPVNGAWNTNARAALRDFKVVNHLANDDVWDVQTSERLASPTAIRADQSFIGRWSKAPCRSAAKDNLRLTIDSRRVKSSAGGVCEFHDFTSDHGGWRVRTTCSQAKQRWKADGKFAVRENKLIWTSEGDVSSYFRCN
jgi:hypothetical protein